MASATVGGWVTREEYWAALDGLDKAVVLEAQKAAAGEATLTAWWKVAEPRWRELDDVLTRAERLDRAAATTWFQLHRVARKAGKAPGSVNLHEADLRLPLETIAAQRQRETAPRRRRIENAGSV